MTREEPIVFIVDDDEAMCEATRSLVAAAGMRAEAFSSALDFVGASRPDVPACLVLDVHLPGLSGLDLQEELAGSDNPLPIIFITAQGDIPTSVRAMRGGAVEFLTKPFAGHQLLEAIRHGIARDRVERRHRAELASVRRRYESLTPREREVMVHVVAGLLNKQIAAALGTSQITVKVHRAQVMRKMRVKSLADLVRLAERLAA